MNAELREAQAKFNTRMPELLANRKELYALRKKFVHYFNLQKIKRLKIEEYALGNYLLPNDLLFCYTLEQGLDGLGRIRGAPAFKFGIYYGKSGADTRQKYRFTRKFGKNSREAFENVREALIDLLIAGKAGDLDRIAGNLLSSMFKGKILNTYYPNRYLNIFSYKHLDHFLVHLNLDTKELIHADDVYKREELVRFKNSDRIMKNWSLEVFTEFLYLGYPGGLNRNSDDTRSPDSPESSIPEFPPNPEPEQIELKIGHPKRKETSTRSGRQGGENPDYEKQTRLLKRYGDRGEKIVIDFEKKRLTSADRRDLAKQVTKIKHDYEGFDIMSWEVNGSPRQIEVKATKGKAGSVTFFLSQNELDKARILKNYFLYIVFEILSETPKVWPVPNPFHPENRNVVRKPVNYRVRIETI